MSKPFFLTPQTANLMEDFVRDLESETGLHLIHGDSGVGKTRFLEELMQTGLEGSKVRWMDLQVGGSGDGALVDSSLMIEETFALAMPGDIIVADHFETGMEWQPAFFYFNEFRTDTSTPLERVDYAAAAGPTVNWR